jgi:hypothetical protein
LQNCNLVILELLPLLFSGSKNDWECGKWNAKKGCFLHTESSRLKTKKYLSNIRNMCNILKNIQFLLKLKKKSVKKDCNFYQILLSCKIEQNMPVLKLVNNNSVVKVHTYKVLNENKIKIIYQFVSNQLSI